MTKLYLEKLACSHIKSQAYLYVLTCGELNISFKKPLMHFNRVTSKQKEKLNCNLLSLVSGCTRDAARDRTSNGVSII